MTLNSKETYSQTLYKQMGYRHPQVRYCLDKMVASLSEMPHMIMCDYNGSARINSIDRKLIKNLGVNFYSIHDRLGEFKHDIVPEGESLSSLKKTMSSVRWKNHRVLFGYAVDCDGDRGNIVLRSLTGNNHHSQLTAFIPDAQTTFALSVLAELCYTSLFFPERLPKTIVVANGPTSLRIDHLVQAFNVKMVRVEVGEPNVVALARRLMRKGFHVPIMGEGSNGGSIIPPLPVRDPLGMVVSLIKLLFLKKGQISLREIARKQLNCPKSFAWLTADNFLSHIVPYLNTFSSTSVFDPNALLQLPCSSQKRFKEIYEQVFLREWEKKYVQKWEIENYKIIHYQGTQTIVGSNPSKGEQSGGLKISFFNCKEVEIAYIWFRYSKTEPVLRLSAEHREKSIQTKLFEWQKKMLLETSRIDQERIPYQND